MSRPSRAYTEFALVIPALIIDIENTSQQNATEICRVIVKTTKELVELDLSTFPFPSSIDWPITESIELDRRNWYRWRKPGGPIPRINDLLTIVKVCREKGWISDPFMLKNSRFFDFIDETLKQRLPDADIYRKRDDAMQRALAARVFRQAAEALFIGADILILHDEHEERLHTAARMLGDSISAQVLKETRITFSSVYASALEAMAENLIKGAKTIRKKFEQAESEIRFDGGEKRDTPIFSNPHKL